jgi:hypothetical protein
MTAQLKNMSSGLTAGKAMTGPTVGAGYVKGLLDFAVSKQASRARLMERAQISADDLADLDNRIPLENYKALMKAGVELTNDAALAVHYGEAFDLSELSIAGLSSTRAQPPQPYLEPDEWRSPIVCRSSS